jgi:hypothetical protein
MQTYADLQRRQAELCQARGSLVPIVIAAKVTVARCDDVLADGPGTGFSYLHAWKARRDAMNSYLSAVAELVDVEAELDKIEQRLRNSHLALPLPQEQSHV